jgi:hypothetical protein
VCDRAADEADVEEPRPDEVADEPRAAGQQLRVLDAGSARADGTRPQRRNDGVR